jgi:nucleotide-binding universal stress UspA family protein
MQNILVPVDFSPTSQNAALYAAGLAEQIGSKKLVLYNAFQTILSNFHANPDGEGLDEQDLRPLQEEAMHALKLEMLRNTSANIRIESHCVYEGFEDDLTEVCKKTNTQRVVMGITGGGKLKEKLIGSHTLKVARNSANQVIIVPPNARFSAIRKVMLLTDYNHVDETTPFDVIHQVIIHTQASLDVVHIEADPASKERNTDIIQHENAVMHQHLLPYFPKYFTAYNPSFEQAIHDITKERAIDLIIIIPKKIGFFDRLLNASHTDLLAFHSHVPILVAHK